MQVPLPRLAVGLGNPGPGWASKDGLPVVRRHLAVLTTTVPEHVARPLRGAGGGGQGLPEPRHYCYPSGDYDHNAHAALQEIGDRSATTCLPGLIDTATGRDVSYLPRFLDGERIHALEFEAEMSGFSDFLKRLAGRG